ncbi:hypothetical protein [Delftia phage PhiW-14]|uniref:Uncharacterized protein n=1 Tax=Delftia phage PhiW-14 TaxID=665032 RepID=C9DG26_BPW14|nr:hypothetical protein DP-phiW-14_gp055 [Delftia phage PhiW-14]ACV50077.1 hypothetical protein [Delftia phage PhiW-14]
MKMKKSGILGSWHAAISLVPDANYRDLYTVPAGIDIAIVKIMHEDAQLRFAVNGSWVPALSNFRRNLYLKAGDVVTWSKGGSSSNFFNIMLAGQEFVLESTDNPYIALNSSADPTTWSLIYTNPNTWSHVIYPVVNVTLGMYVIDSTGKQFFKSADRTQSGTAFDNKIFVPPGGSVYARYNGSTGGSGVMRIQGIQLP